MRTVWVEGPGYNFEIDPVKFGEVSDEEITASLGRIGLFEDQAQDALPKVREAVRAWRAREASTKRNRRSVMYVLLALVLAAAIVLVAMVVGSLPSGQAAALASATCTPTVIPISPTIAAATSEPFWGEELVYLRVEVQVPINFPKGYWGSLPKVGIFLSPYVDGDKVPDPGRAGTVLQVVESRKTKDNSLVAVTTFSVPPGIYWVGVNNLPLGCSVWIPRFEDDLAEMTPVSWGPPLILDQLGVMYTWKFQVVCGLAPTATEGKGVTVPTATSSPLPSPTPSGVPPTPTGTSVPPTATGISPTPTESCGPDCVEPKTPVPTEYPAGTPTPTPIR